MPKLNSVTVLPHVVVTQTADLKTSAKKSEAPTQKTQADGFDAPKEAWNKKSTTKPTPPRTTAEKNLNTHPGRVAFWADWQKLQLSKELEGKTAGGITINGIRFNGKEGRELMRQGVLVAYCENAKGLSSLADELHEAKLRADTSAMSTIGQKIDTLEQSLDELERMLHAHGIKKCWDDTSAQKLYEQIEAANELFRKKATSQTRVLGQAPFKVDKATIKEPLKLRCELALLRKSISVDRSDYSWDKYARFVMGSTSRLPESTVIEFGAQLKPGVINLESREGLERATSYCQALRKAIDSHGSGAGTIVINGQLVTACKALALFTGAIDRAYQQLGKRYTALDSLVREKICAYATDCALLNRGSLDKLNQDLAPTRREMYALRTQIAELDKQVSPTAIDPKLQTLLRQKAPAATHERQTMAKSIRSTNQSHQKQWDFLARTCDSANVEQLFSDHSLTQLTWSLNPSAKMIRFDEPNQTEQAWLKGALFNTAEIAKSEWAHRDKLKKFADLTSDPVFRKMIGNESDKSFLDEATKLLRAAQKHSTDFAVILDQALGVQMVNEDYNSNTFSDELKAKLLKRSPEETEATLVKVVNVFSLATFAYIGVASNALLSDNFVSRWNKFLEKHKSTIETYWDLPRNKLSKADTRGPLTGYNNMAYVPTQRRLANYTGFWDALKKDAPAPYSDAMELAHLRASLKIKTINHAS